MKIARRKTKVVKIGKVLIGGKHPIAIQSMAKYKTEDAAKVIKQIKDLQAAGCEIVRLAIKDSLDASALRVIKKETNIPLVADIHFDWRLAMEAIDSGADKIRLNPGNIDKKEQIAEIAKLAAYKKIPIRVGLNSGSLPRAGDGKKNSSVADAMVKSCLSYLRILESLAFRDIVISLKASNIFDTIEAYRKMAKLCEYPFHLGVTATGLPLTGALKSSIALGVLLLEGIGDTIRVSLTEDPCQEVKVAQHILEALEMRNFGPKIISCPTCGRCEVDLLKIVKELEKKITPLHPANLKKAPVVAIMGCVVNGPGEAREADIGIAFGRKKGLLFKKGKPVKKVAFVDSVNVLLREMAKFK